MKALAPPPPAGSREPSKFTGRRRKWLRSAAGIFCTSGMGFTCVAQQCNSACRGRRAPSWLCRVESDRPSRPWSRLAATCRRGGRCRSGSSRRGRPSPSRVRDGTACASCANKEWCAVPGWDTGTAATARGSRCAPPAGTRLPPAMGGVPA